MPANKLCSVKDINPGDKSGVFCLLFSFFGGFFTNQCLRVKGKKRKIGVSVERKVVAFIERPTFMLYAELKIYFYHKTILSLYLYSLL